MMLVIDRPRWYRGRDYSSLIVADGQMCCLGFYLKELGATDDQIRGVDMPETLADCNELPADAGWLVERGAGGEYCFNSQACTDLARVNDAQDLTDEAREQLITGMFAKHGVEVTFR